MKSRRVIATTVRVFATAVVSGAVLVTAAGLAGAQEPDPAGKRAGDVTVVRPESETRLSSGGSTTDFQLRLPLGAECQGDSVDGGYRAQTFVVPGADQPGGLTFDVMGPAGEGRYALVGLDTNAAVHLLTAVAASPGGPGPVTDLPVFNFSIWPPQTLSDGMYRFGVACTVGAEVTRYWDTVVEIENTEDDEPAQLRWAVADGASSSDSASNPLPAALGVALVVVAALAIFRFARRRPSTRPSLTNLEEK